VKIKTQELKDNSQTLRSDPYFVWSTRITLITLAFCFFFLLISWTKLPSQVPLFYSLPWGEEQLAQPWSLVLLCSGALLMCLINILVAFFSIRRTPYFSRMLLVGSVVVAVLTLITIMQIIRIVT
jgi:hypothetical protein